MAKPIYIYTGTEWVPVGPQIGNVSYNWIYTATGGETSLSGTDDNGITLTYTPNYEQVYLNGVLLIRGTDYNAASSSSITGLTALTNGDVINILVLETTTVDNTYTQAQADALINVKANIDSPTFTGTPTAPLADQGDMSSQLANTQFVNRELLPVTQFAAAGSDLLNLPAKVHPGEKLLKEAVYYIDAAHESAGNQEISNLGWGGNVLNTRSGSSTAEDSNDPKHLDWDGTNYVYLPGVSGNYLSVPDEDALDITGDIDIRVRVALDDWTPAANQVLLSKWLTTGGQRSYGLRVLTTGVVRLAWSADGAAELNADSTVASGLTDGSVKWIRATLDVDNGASGRSIQFFTSDNGSTWTQLGSTVTQAGATSVFSGTANVEVGSQVLGVTQASGNFYRAQVLNGINGTPVLDVDTSLVPNGDATTFPALTGQTVTINKSTSGRKAVAVCHPQWLLGTDDFMEVDNKHFDANSVAGYAALPGVSGSYLSVPDEAALDITGDIDIRVRVAMDDWTPAVAQTLISKYFTSTNDRSWRLDLNGATQLVLTYSSDGLAFPSAISSAFTAVDGQTIWVRVTADVDNGSGGADIKFYQSDDGETWTQVGSTQTVGTPISFYSGAADINISTFNNGASQPIKGKVFRAQIFDGIDGTKVLDVDPTVAAAGDSSFTALTGQTVSVNGQARLAPHGFVYLPGVAGNYLSVQDSAALDITGDLDLRAFVAADDWTPGTGTRILGKWSTGGQFSYVFKVLSTGAIGLEWSEDGSTTVPAFKAGASIALTVTDGEPLWVRVTLDVDNGAGGYDLKFYTSSDGNTWTQLGSTITGASTTSIFSSTSNVEVGTSLGGSVFPFAGRMYRAQILDGIDGTIALDVDCSQLSGDVDSFTESSENAATVTVNRSGSAYRSVGIVRSGYVLPGASNVFRASEVSLLDFDENDSYTLLAVWRQWPTPATNSVVIGKKASAADIGSAGWSLAGSNKSILRISDGVTRLSASSPTSSGSLLVAGGFKDGTELFHFMQGTLSSPTDVSLVGSLGNSVPLAIGKASGGSSNFYDMELIAVAIFRRALTSGEITALNNYFQGRIGG